MSGKHPLVQAVEQSQLKQNVPSFAPGDTVIVQVKVKEGDRERLQRRPARDLHAGNAGHRRPDRRSDVLGRHPHAFWFRPNEGWRDPLAVRADRACLRHLFQHPVCFHVENLRAANNQVGDGRSQNCTKNGDRHANRFQDDIIVKDRGGEEIIPRHKGAHPGIAEKGKGCSPEIARDARQVHLPHLPRLPQQSNPRGNGARQCQSIARQHITRNQHVIQGGMQDGFADKDSQRPEHENSGRQHAEQSETAGAQD